MGMDTAGWERLASEIGQDRDRLARRESFMIWGLLAGTPMTLFGKPLTVEVSWPEGLPLNFTSPDELRTYAREQMAKLTDGVTR